MGQALKMSKVGCACERALGGGTARSRQGRRHRWRSQLGAFVRARDRRGPAEDFSNSKKHVLSYKREHRRNLRMDLLHFFWACNLAMHLPVCALIAGGAFAPAKYRRDSPCNRECQRVAAAAGYSHLTIALTQGLQHLTVCTELVFSVYLILCLSTALPDVRDVLRAVLFPAGVVVGVGFWTFCLWSPSPKELEAPYPDPSRTPSLGQCELATRQVDHLSARRFLEGRGQGTVGGVCDTCVSRRVSCGTWHTTWYVSGAPNILAAVPPLAVPTLLAHALAAHADAASAVGRGRALRLSHAAAACSFNRGHGGRRVRLWLAHMVRRVLLARPQGASISDSSPRLGQR